MKKKVFYYTSAYFLDVSVELINVLKKHVDLYVFIEITDSSKTSTILNIEKLLPGRSVVPAEEMMAAADLENFKAYFDGTRAVNFVVHNYPVGNILKMYRAAAPLRKMIRQIRPDVLHFEGFTMRTMGLLPMLRKVKKLVFSVHDSQVHSGMQHLKVSLPRMAMFRWPVKKQFVFYSDYCRQDFLQNVKHSKAAYLTLGLGPFYFYKKISLSKPEGSKYLLFFGRISKYKGLNLLLDAMETVWKEFPGEQLVIAGGGADAALQQHPVLKRNDGRILFLNRFIPTAELPEIIKEAKYVICPYTDATQSGVLSTSFALNKPVLATDVGAFREQIFDEFNGKLVKEPAPELIAAAIIASLRNDHYKQWEENVRKQNLSNSWEKNAQLLLKAYEV
ncbi:MAG: glycosyltransferase family 4 protein [Ferruginibacter sp.]